MKNNQDFQTSCIRFGDAYKCPACQSDRLVKYGKTGNGKQRYLCKNCRKRFIKNYTYKAYQADTNSRIVQLTKEGLGIRSTARVLAISATTLLKRILQIASGIKRPAISIGKTYEVIFIGRKTRLRWIVYALDRESREIVGFNVGRRTNRTLGVVLTSLFLSKAKRIHTDKLKNYGYLIPSKSHRTTFRSTNHIERRNLTLRTHLKRLNRKTICYSRSLVMLFAILRIYFWG